MAFQSVYVDYTIGACTVSCMVVFENLHVFVLLWKQTG